MATLLGMAPVEKSASDSDHVAVRNREASGERRVLQKCKRLLQICDVRVESEEHSILCYRKLSDFLVRLAGKARIGNSNGIVSKFSQNRRLIWREILVEKKSHEARMISLLASPAAY